uniref:Uncharacterized protein n=1 Tax=Fagus sylvatica TaxID=28930 RepID=A0A2N9GSP5_FAGSY
MPPKRSTRHNSVANSHAEAQSHGHSRTMGETHAFDGGHIAGGENPFGGGHDLGGQETLIGGPQQMALLFEMIKRMQQTQAELAESLREGVCRSKFLFGTNNKSLFNQLGFAPEARNAATEALITIATESGATCFTAEAHTSHAFLETTNAITFTDEDMEVQYPDHRRPLYLSTVVKDVQVRHALVDTGSCLNLILLSTLQAANVPQQKIQGFPMEVTGLGGVTEYTMGHCVKGRLNGKPIRIAANSSPFDQTEAHFVEAALYDDLASTGEPSIVRPCGTPLPTWDDIKDDPKVDLRELLERKKKRKEHVFASNYDEMPGIDPGLVAHSLNVEPGTKPVHPLWLSNIVPVKKKNGQIRCCVNFRNLNKSCPKDEFPLPNVDLLIDSAAGHAMFSFVDRFSGYNQIRISTKDAEKTAFRIPIGNFYYTVMPFGLKNAGATYQRIMTAMFHDMMNKEIEDYVDDIVVKSKKREDHLETLRKVFDRFRLYKLKMNPLKCVFGVFVGKFLGFLVHNRGIDVDPAKASAITTMKAPTSHKELKSFLGRLSYIRRFIPGLAIVTATFTSLMKKGVPFVWSTACQQAFEKIQVIMTKLPIVCASVAGRPLRLYLSSNSQAIGALVAQEDESGTEKPVYYVSRTLRDAGTRYSGAERACLALIYASQRLRHYFLAHKIQLMTKSHPIRSLLYRPILSGRLAQWLLQLSQYEIITETPMAIKSQAIVDLLAQFPGEDSSSISHEVPGGVGETLLADLVDSIWTLKFDGSSTSSSSRVGIVLIKEDGETIAKSFKLDFSCSNNASEYEANITRLPIAHEMGIKHLRVIGDSNLVICQTKGEFSLKEPSLAPYCALAQKLEEKFDTFEVSHAMRCGNRYADALATLGSQISFEGPKVDVTINKRSMPITDLLKEEFEEQCHDAEDWWTPIKAKLMSLEGVADLKTLKDYVLIAGDLYRRLPGGVLARCVSLREAAKKLTKVHERSCEFRDGVSLYRRLQRLGYFWPNMSKEATNLQEQCSFCQHQHESDKVYATFISSDWRTPFLEYFIENVLPQTSKAAI